MPTLNGRAFNYVPGMEAVPLAFGFDRAGKINIKITFSDNNHEF
jgi:hypothetical protein